MKLRHWVHGLVATVIGGGANAVTVMIIDPLQFNLHEGWRNLMTAIIVSGIVSASLYLKQSPLPPEDDGDPKPPDKFTTSGGIKMSILVLSCLLLTNCQTLDFQKTLSEQKAKDYAGWVKERSGFIEDAVASITRVAVYATEKDTFERTRTIEIMKALAGNINALVHHNGTVNVDEIKEALRIDEPYFASVTSAITSLIQLEMDHFKENGYGDLSISILDAVSAGIRDGVTE